MKITSTEAIHDSGGIWDNIDTRVRLTIVKGTQAELLGLAERQYGIKSFERIGRQLFSGIPVEPCGHEHDCCGCCCSARLLCTPRDQNTWYVELERGYNY